MKSFIITGICLFIAGKIIASDSLFTANDQRIIYAPYVWRDGIGFKETINAGAYLRISFKGTGAKFLLEELSIIAEPYIRIMVDGLPPKDVRIHSGQKELILCDSLKNGIHSVEVIYDGRGSYYAYSWDGGQRLKITGIQVYGGGLVFGPKKMKKAIFFGDSITEADQVGGIDDNKFRNGVNAYPRITSYALNCEWGQVGFGGMGWTFTALGGIPPLAQSWSFFSENNSRLKNGKLLPEPDYVFVNMGTNDALNNRHYPIDSIKSFIEQLRRAAPLSNIFIIVPFGRYYFKENRDAVAAYKKSHLIDRKIFVIDLGNQAASGQDTQKNNIYSFDGLHPTAEMHGRLGALLAGKVLEIISH